MGSWLYRQLFLSIFHCHSRSRQWGSAASCVVFFLFHLIFNYHSNGPSQLIVRSDLVHITTLYIPKAGDHFSISFFFFLFSFISYRLVLFFFFYIVASPSWKMNWFLKAGEGDRDRDREIERTGKRYAGDKMESDTVTVRKKVGRRPKRKSWWYPLR